jgi:hypothetical protein
MYQWANVHHFSVAGFYRRTLGACGSMPNRQKLSGTTLDLKAELWEAVGMVW